MEPNKLAVSKRMKKVTFRGQIISYQEKIALEDLENAIREPAGPNDRPVYRDIGLKVKKKHVIE